MTGRVIRFTVRLQMCSDWSIGSGSGRQGALDSLVERDADGLPFVPATTLRGIWRDAAEQLAYGLDDGTKGGWCRIVDHVFGNQPALDARNEPIGSRLVLADARLPCDLAVALHGRPRLRQALVIVKPGVAIDKKSGRARAQFLRFEEVARQGAVLEAAGSIALADDGEVDPALVCLAFAATRLVTRIGGNRRRGSGRCEMTLPHDAEIIEAGADGREAAVSSSGLPVSVKSAIAAIEQTKPTEPKPPERRAAPLRFAKAQDSTFTIVPLDITLETAAVVAHNVLGNVVTSLDHVPGTMLLAGVGRMLAQAGADAAAVAQAFANGDIRVLPAYPVIDRERGLPVPFAREDDWRETINRGSQQIKSLERYYFAHRGEVRLTRQRLLTRTHNIVEDLRQTPTEDVGGVFTYEAIPAGTRLKSEIWIRSGLLAQQQLDALGAAEAPVTIGRAKKAGYGAVRLAAQPARPLNVDVTVASANGATLYLASDMLLPSASASPRAALSVAIAKAIGKPVRIADGIVRTTRTEGWIAHWSLPRPSYVLIRAGSSASMSGADGALTSGLLARLLREGLGERRAEGFGHVLLGLPGDSGSAVVIETPPDVGAPSDIQIAGDFATGIENAALRDAIRLQAECVAADDASRKRKLGWTREKPNMSQLGALRAVMSGLQSDGDLEQAREFVAALGKSDRKTKWGDEDAAPHPLSELESLFGAPAGIWQRIDFIEAEVWNELLVTRDLVTAQADAELQRHAIASYLLAAMRWHKRRMEHADDPGSGG